MEAKLDRVPSVAPGDVDVLTASMSAISAQRESILTCAQNPT